MWSVRLRTTIFWSLLGVTAFNALSSMVSGVALLATGDLGMPATFLETSPFPSFTVPGVILVVVVGGTQAVASALLVVRRESALFWSAVAGFGMLIWIFTEVVFIREASWLQVLYFATGTVQLVLVLALLGIVSWLPRAPLRRPAVPERRPVGSSR
ncbi:hypothetical protein SAMN05216219_1183 [Mycetocola miduiensis]|uniref:Uncharacterized protein n=1 Tax=Mycetocola miduiensis TaxID=995034 RepID=A0A1I4ZYI4_9MICO|nr:hypothetical protein SAMN05216219_1183 [Mycetocola miduiensis]